MLSALSSLMSVTFSVMNTETDWDDYSSYLNCANGNARDLLQALGLDSDELYGSCRARDLRERAERVMRVPDGGIEPEQDGRVIYCGRQPGRMHDYCRALLDLCERAGDLGVIGWG